MHFYEFLLEYSSMEYFSAINSLTMNIELHLLVDISTFRLYVYTNSFCLIFQSSNYLNARKHHYGYPFNFLTQN